MVVMASQKSAPVAVTLISYVTSDPAQQGLLAIPSIVGQLSQIFIGAALAKYLAPRVRRTAGGVQLYRGRWVCVREGWDDGLQRAALATCSGTTPNVAFDGCRKGLTGYHRRRCGSRS